MTPNPYLALRITTGGTGYSTNLAKQAAEPPETYGLAVAATENDLSDIPGRAVGRSGGCRGAIFSLR
jgi:hypothetical protein